MTDTCARCGEPLPDGATACPACGNDPRRRARIVGVGALLAGVPVFFLMPPVAVVLWVVGLFALVGSWFLSAATHEF